MQKRSFFQNIFKGRPKPTNTRQAETSTGHSSFFPWSGRPYDSDIARAAISSNAMHMAKLQPRHIRREKNDIVTFPDPNIKRILQRPNPYMGMYDLIAKSAAQREEHSNAFIFVKWSGGVLAGLFPILYSSANLLETESGELFLQFAMRSGKEYVLPYNEVIHLRKHFNHDDLFGEGNFSPLDAPLSVLHTIDQGMTKAIKRGAHLRGLLEYKQSIRPEDMKQQADEFTANFLTMDNDGGVAAADSKYTYRELSQNAYVPNKPQMEFAKERVYSYYGTNDAVIQSKFTDAEWNAYYESIIEPFAIQLSEEFTEKLFTPTERAHGNEIIFYANRLQSASIKAKLDATKLVELGLMSRNEYRLDILDRPPIEGGDKYIISLNYIEADKAAQYQVGETEESKNAEE